MANTNKPNSGEESQKEVKNLDLTPLMAPGTEEDFDDGPEIPTFQPGDLSTGDLFNPDETDNKLKGKSGVRGNLRILAADFPAAVNLWFHSWLYRHYDEPIKEATNEKFCMFVVDALFRDVMADRERPEDKRYYDSTLLQLDALVPLIDATIRSRHEEVIEADRRAVKQILQVLIDQGKASKEVLIAVEKGVAMRG